MVRRIQKLSKTNSLFLFGARGTGKSTLLHAYFTGKTPKNDCLLWIDLLTAHDEERFGHDPDELSRVLAINNYQWVVIDEIQKFPKLLDIVHHEIETHKNIQFILTGSSSRKLKRGSANLLGGRAFTYLLFPFTFIELGKDFDLINALSFGTLPKIFSYGDNNDDKSEFLRSYVRTYLKEEIQAEQIVRDLSPFRDFLEIASQGNGKIINFSKIARDVHVDDKTVKSYFQILEDTLIGFFLPPFHRSIRKRQREASKFYFFDLGVKRALDRTLRVPLVPGTFAFGEAFEHLILCEMIRLNEYLKMDYRFSYLRTKDDAEIDLIVERPGMPDLLIEIKSTGKISIDDYRTLKQLGATWDRACEMQVWSMDRIEKKDESIHCIFWQTAMQRLFLDCSKP